MLPFKVCVTCGATYTKNRHITRAQWGRSRYCSRACHSVSLIGGKHTEEHKAKISAASRGHVTSDEQKRKVSLANTGKKPCHKNTDTYMGRAWAHKPEEAVCS